MMAAATPMVFILTVDQHILVWVLAITFFFVLSMIAVLSRGRKWYELASIFLITYAASLLLAGFIFQALLNLPFARLETVSLP